MFDNYSFAKKSMDPASQCSSRELVDPPSMCDDSVTRFTPFKAAENASTDKFCEPTATLGATHQEEPFRASLADLFDKSLPREQKAQRLPALELFVGFEGHEIVFLEQHVLFYVREAMRKFLTQSNLPIAPTQSASCKDLTNFGKYRFKSDAVADPIYGDEPEDCARSVSLTQSELHEAQGEERAPMADPQTKPSTDKLTTKESKRTQLARGGDAGAMEKASDCNLANVMHFAEETA